ncbi:MAG: efflux RND transporter permease subunit [candidate division Zixibacteria bacterium]|nr:efflux RND transporter permease subunit [candidate division Zixibacteria bacterium]
MFLPNLSIRRPVFIVMQVLAVLVLGVVSYSRIGIDLMPDVEFPYISITAVYPGVGAQEIENQVTKPIEEAMSAINRLKNIYSTSAEGFSQILLEFDIGVKVRDADSDVRQKLSEIRSKLPQDMDEPTIARFDVTATPIMIFSLASNLPLDELRVLADDKVKNRIQQTEEVAQVDLIGGLEREIKVEVDKNKLKAYNLSVDQVIGSLSRENLNIPGGRVEIQPQEFVLRTTGEFQEVSDIGKIPVANYQGTPVHLKDVASVKDSFKELREIAQLNSRPSVSFIVYKQSGGNTVKVCDRLKKTIASLKKELPAGTSIEIASDQSKFVRRSVNETMRTLYLGAIFATLVIFIFLGNFRSTIIAALAIPTSILATFVMMGVFGYTINMMTLMGLSLCVGILIDDAIVVRENIFRHVEEGMDPEEASRFGTSEVGLAVMACTFTIIAVFVPTAYMGGIVGKFFKAFAFTVVFAVLYSLWDSFTMAPMLSAKVLVKEKKDKDSLLKRLFAPFNRGYHSLNQSYGKTLAWALKYKLLIIATSIILFFLSLSLTFLLGKEFMPQGDRGEFNVILEEPVGTSIQTMEKTATEVEKILFTYPEVQSVFTTIGLQAGASNKGTIRVELVPLKDRKKKTVEVEKEIRQRLSEVPGLKSQVAMIGMFEGQQQDYPLTLYIKGPEIRVLDEVSAKVLDMLERIPGVADPDRSIRSGKPEMRVIVDREKASRLGISTAQIAMTLRFLVDGDVATKLRQGEKEIDVRVILPPEQKNNFQDIASVNILTPAGIAVPLSSIASLQEGVGPTQINRQNRERVAILTANLVDRPLGDIVKDLNKKLADYPLPPGYKIEQRGDVEMMGEMFYNMILVLVIGVIFIYIVLGSQFNSFLHPFTIMLALPLAVVGALLAIFLTGQRINMMAMVGIILLMGIVTKNSILLIDYTITLRKRGMGREEALLKAGPVRLRPILMTSAAMIMGMLPAALGIGEGAEWRQSMGIVVIGGLITSTLLTLLVVPVTYVMVDNFGEFLKRNIKIGG